MSRPAAQGAGRGTILALLLAACATLVALQQNTWSAGGADASGYLSQAHLLARGRVTVEQPLAAEAPWPEPAWTFSPLGYRPGFAPGEIVPTYPPGLPLLLAPFAAIGGTAPFLVVPILAGLAVFATARLGRATGSELVGLAAAACLAASPIFVRQSTQVMSDVPAAASWTLALALAYGGSLRSALASGVVTALAILIRPNLAPLAAAVLLAVARPRGEIRVRAVVAWAVPVAAGVLVLSLLHTHLYGSPTRSGYGSAGELYALANVPLNLQRYGSWIASTEIALILLLVPAAFAFGATRGATPRASRAPLALVCALTVASYLPYAVFDDWWYTRFLLPAFPPLLVLGFTGVDRLLGERAFPIRASAMLLLCLVAAGHGWTVMSARGVIGLQRFESRYALAAQLTTNRPGAIVLAAQHSGSLRAHGGPDTLRWDLLAPRDLERALAFLRDRGRTPLVLVDAPEEPLFRARFAGHSALGQLDWPPSGEVHTPIAVRLYDPSLREVYLAGGRVDTQHVFPPRR